MVKPDGGGLRYSEGKPPMHMVPWDVLPWVAERYAYGAAKYGPEGGSARNWERGMAWSQVFDPIMRHLTAWWQGEELEAPETAVDGAPLEPQHHLQAAAWGILALCAYHLRGIGTDDRPHRVEVQDCPGGDVEAWLFENRHSRSGPVRAVEQDSVVEVDDATNDARALLAEMRAEGSVPHWVESWSSALEQLHDEAEAESVARAYTVGKPNVTSSMTITTEGAEHSLSVKWEVLEG